MNNIMHQHYTIRIGIAPKNEEMHPATRRCYVWDWSSYESFMSHACRMYSDDDMSKEYEIREVEDLSPCLQKKYETSNDMKDFLRRVFEYCKLNKLQRVMVDTFVKYFPDKWDGKSIKKLLKMATDIQILKCDGEFTLPESWPTEAKEAFKNIASGLKNVRYKKDLEKLFNDNHVCYYGFNWEYLLVRKYEFASDGYKFYNHENFDMGAAELLLDYIVRQFKIPEENKIVVQCRTYSPIIPELSEVEEIEAYNEVWWKRKR